MGNKSNKRVASSNNKKNSNSINKNKATSKPMATKKPVGQKQGNSNLKKNNRKNQSVKKNNQINSNNNYQTTKRIVNNKVKLIKKETLVKKDVSSNKKIKPKKKIFKYFVIVVLCVLSVVLYIFMRPKFKDVTIELGVTNTVSIDNFLVSKSYKNDAMIITDISNLDLSKVAEYEIVLAYKKQEQKVKLKVVDTTPPKVIFKDVIGYLDYKINADDFIEKKEDFSEMIVTASEITNLNEFKSYVVKVTVKDKYNNITSKECLLTIAWIKSLVYIELGEPFSKEDIILSMANDADKILASEIKKVDTFKVGEYILLATKDGKEYESKVIVQDTVAPELNLKDITLEFGEKIKSKNVFIQSVKDASGEVTTTIKNEIDYNKLGTQDVIIEAVDINGNKTIKTAILTIKKTGSGPVFSGIKSLTVEKYQVIDYKSGIKAVDAKDGIMEFNVDSSKVNTGIAGTYYAVYSATDKDGNETKINRKITVLHDEEDTNQKFDEFYNKYLSGKSILDMVTIIRTKITYSYNDGGDDPVWHALNSGDGDCYVHAILTQKALDKAGINNILIYVYDKTHYWNLVEVGGVWRHYDSTPGTHIKGPANDSEKFKSSGMAGRDWDRDAFPRAL